MIVPCPDDEVHALFRVGIRIIRMMIDGENKVAPYTDEELSDLLAEKDFVVARRTATKYRELLGISKRSEMHAVSK